MGDLDGGEREQQAGMNSPVDLSGREVQRVTHQHVKQVVTRLRNRILVEGPYVQSDNQLQGWHFRYTGATWTN